jgi:hypothetical protein
VSRADRARELWEILAFPSFKDFVWMISNGKLIDSDVTVTVHDVYRMLKIFGTDPSVVKGRTTRKKPEPVIVETIQREISGDITLSADIMFVDGLPFFVSISKKIAIDFSKISVRQVSKRIAKGN